MTLGRTWSCCAPLALTAVALLASAAHGQTAARSRRGFQPSDAPNIPGEADSAAMNLVDSLFEPLAPADPLPGLANRALGVPPTNAQRPKWSARLARNPHPDDGNPPYVLIDRYGGIQRYIEPVDSVDLSRHLGEVVGVRRDTGGALLASQLDLPRTAPMRLGAAPDLGLVDARAGGVRLAAHQAPVAPPDATPLEPTPAGEADAAARTGAAMSTPGASSAEGEIIEQGPMMDDGSYQGYEGEMYQGGEMIVPDGVDPLYLDGNSEMGFGQCPTCGDGICGGMGCNDGCGFGSRPVFYARGEYLHWWFSGMDLPPLVVNAGINNPPGPANATPALPAQIVFGGDDVLDDDRQGARITLGYFLDDCGKLGIEADYITFGDESTGFFQAGDGVTTYIGRPFVDTANGGVDSVEHVALTETVTGSVAVNIDSRFQSAGLRLRRGLCCVAGCSTDCGDCVGCGNMVGGCDSCANVGGCCPIFPALSGKVGRIIRGGTRHVDVLYGVRWAELEEGLAVHEDLDQIRPVAAHVLVDDAFNTSNQFFGGEIGFLVDWQRRRWSVEFLSKLAIGSTQQRVTINGSTFVDDGVNPAQTFQGIGLLAQPTNVGVHERDEFSVIPEIGLTGGYLLTERLRVTLGYTLLYWSRVVRPGDQIDLDVNSDFLRIPEGIPPTVARAPAPEFVFRDTDLWAHGFNAGLDYRW